MTMRQCITADAPPSRSRTHDWILAGILLSALALRLVFALHVRPPMEWTPDAFVYDGLARSLLENGTLPSAYRSPGYPVFVAFLYGLFGPSTLAVSVVQAFLSTLAVGLTYRLGREILGDRRRGVCLIAAALVGLNPEIAAYSATVLRETITMVLVLLTAWLCLRMLTKGGWYTIALGVALAALAYVRMEACLLVLVVLGGCLFHKKWRKPALQRGGWAVGIVLLAVFPWIVHCGLHRGYWGIQDTLDNCLFYRSWYLSPEGRAEPELRRHILDVVRRYHLTDEEVRRCMITPRLVQELPRDDVKAEAGLYRKLGRIGRENIRTHPRRYVTDCAYHFRAIVGGYWLFWWKTYWDMPPFSENIRRGQWWVVAIKVANRAVWPAVVIGFGVVALVGLWRQKDPAALFMNLLWLGSMAGIVLVVVVASGEPRLRQAYDGILYLAAVLGLSIAWRAVRPSGACPGGK